MGEGKLREGHPRFPLCLKLRRKKEKRNNEKDKT